MESKTPEGEAPSERGGGSTVAAGGATVLGYRVVELAAQGLMIVMTARLLQPEGRGLYSLAALTALLCAAPLGSVWVGNAYELARRHVTPAEVLGASTVIALVGGVLIGVVALTITPFLGDHWWVVAFPALTTPFLLLARYGEGLFNSLDRIHAVGRITVARVALPLLFITVPLLAGASDRIAIGIWTLSLVVLPVLIYVPLWRVTGGQRLPRDRTLYRRVTGFGLRLSPAQMATIGAQRAGLVVLAVFVSAEAVGVYSVAIAVADVLYVTSYALQVSAFRQIGSGTPEAAIWLSTRALRHGYLLATVGGVLAVPASVIGLSLIVGSGYEDVPLLLALLVPGVIANTTSMTLSTYFAVQIGKPEIITRITLLTAVLSIVSAFPGVALLGAPGAALAASGSAIVGATLLVRRFRRDAGVPPRSLAPGLRELADYRELALSLLRRVRPGTAA